VLQLHSTDQPEVHGIAAEMRTVADEYPERVLIGEIYLPVERLMHYYGGDAPEVHLPFNFQLIDAPWEARALARLIADYEAALPPGGWPNWVLGNHDRPRVAAKLGEAQARVAAMLLLTLRGTPTIYYGDEIGLADVSIPAGLVQDPRELNEPGLGLGRDPVRTPMAWDGSAQGGFSSATPWLPLNADWETRNVAAQTGEEGSMLNLYRALLKLRREHKALAIGDFLPVECEGDVLAYERRHGGERLLVALNLGGREQSFVVSHPTSDVLLSTCHSRESGNGRKMRLTPNEGLILRLE